MLSDTRMAEGRSKIVTESMSAEDERTLQTAVNTNAAYAGLRNLKVQTAVDSGVAEVQKAEVDSSGKLALSTEIEGDRALRTMKVRTYENEKRSEAMDNILQKNAEANWNFVSRTDDATQQLRLREVAATDSSKRVEEQWSKKEDGRSKGRLYNKQQ